MSLDDTARRRLRAFSTLHAAAEPLHPLAKLSTEQSRADTRELIEYVAAEPRGSQPISHAISAHLNLTKRVFSLSDVDSPSTEQVAWAWQANAIWVTDEGRILDPAGRQLMDAAGQSPDPAAMIPFPPDARKRRSEAWVTLRNRMIEPVDDVLPLRGAGEIHLVAAEQVASRALALFVAATRAESVLSGHPLDVARMRERCPLGFAALSTNERAFMADPAPSMDAAQGWVWRYEALFAIQWALGMQFELPWPDEHADLTAVTRLMIDLPDASIVEQARCRSRDELLDAAELHHQAFHAFADAAQAGRDLSGVLDMGVVCERLIALAWVGGLAPGAADWDADWDAVAEWVESGCDPFASQTGSGRMPVRSPS